MANISTKISKWHKTRPGLLVFGIVELALAVLFWNSVLIGNNVIDWILAIALTIGFIQNFVKLLGKLFRKNERPSKETN